jgi:hypothetical protein
VHRAYPGGAGAVWQGRYYIHKTPRVGLSRSQGTCAPVPGLPAAVARSSLQDAHQRLRRRCQSVSRRQYGPSATCAISALTPPSRPLRRDCHHQSHRTTTPLPAPPPRPHSPSWQSENFDLTHYQPSSSVYGRFSSILRARSDFVGAVRGGWGRGDGAARLVRY